MLNPIHLRTLVEVVQLGSFAGAANRLGYTASAVSQQMTALEQFVGVPLFERTARSAHPTEAARAMARAAAPVFADLDTILEAARTAHDDTSGEVSVVLYASLARATLARVYADPAFQQSGVRLRITVQDPSAAVRSLAAGDAPDIAFVYRYAGSGLAWPPAVHQVDLGPDPYRLIAPAAWQLDSALRERSPAEVLSGLPWALHHPGTSDANVIEGVFRQAGVRARAMTHSDSFDVVLDLVAAGAASAFVPSVVARLAPPGVDTFDVPGLALSRDVHALVSPSAPGPSTRVVLAAVQRALEPDTNEPCEERAAD